MQTVVPWSCVGGVGPDVRGSGAPSPAARSTSRTNTGPTLMGATARSGAPRPTTVLLGCAFALERLVVAELANELLRLALQVFDEPLHPSRGPDSVMSDHSFLVYGFLVTEPCAYPPAGPRSMPFVGPVLLGSTRRRC